MHSRNQKIIDLINNSAYVYLKINNYGLRRRITFKNRGKKLFIIIIIIRSINDEFHRTIINQGF